MYAFRLGPIWMTEDDLFRNLLVLGLIGSGKTARMMYPFVHTLTQLYRDEDADELSESPTQKCGGVFLEVKGTVCEFVVYAVDAAQRVAANDVVIIRGSPLMPLVEFVDKDDRRFFLNGMASSSGSEVARLYVGKKLRGKEFIGSKLFRNPKELGPREAELREMTVRAPEDLAFVGWRWANGKLRRTVETNRWRDPTMTTETIPAPKELKYVRTHLLDNGVHMNIVNNRTPSAETAKRLSLLAKMSTGEGKDSRNQFFYTQAESVIDHSIQLLRLVEPENEVTAIDIYRIATQETTLSARLTQLGDLMGKLAVDEVGSRKGGNTMAADEAAGKLRRAMDVKAYFTEEWEKLTKKGGEAGSSIKATVANLFGPFMRSPELQMTFCRPTTINFQDLYQKGLIICLVPGEEFEANNRTLGTAVKQEAYSALLGRIAMERTVANKVRVVLFVEDEAWQYIIGGGQDGGCGKFLSMARETRTMNLKFMQSEAWASTAIGQESKVWLGNFANRCWLQQLDSDTNRAAAEICGKHYRESTSVSEDVGFTAMVRGRGGQVRQSHKMEQKDRFEPHDFAHLRDCEMIGYVAGDRSQEEKVVKGEVPFLFSSKKDEYAKIGAAMSIYFQEFWENMLYRTGRWELVDYKGRSLAEIPEEHRPAGYGQIAREKSPAPEPVAPVQDPVRSDPKAGVIDPEDDDGAEPEAEKPPAGQLPKAGDQGFKELSPPAPNPDTPSPPLVAPKGDIGLAPGAKPFPPLGRAPEPEPAPPTNRPPSAPEKALAPPDPSTGRSPVPPWAPNTNKPRRGNINKGNEIFDQDEGPPVGEHERPPESRPAPPIVDATKPTTGITPKVISDETLAYAKAKANDPFARIVTRDGADLAKAGIKSRSKDSLAKSCPDEELDWARDSKSPADPPAGAPTRNFDDILPPESIL
jgi:hypothetical protein